MGKLIQDFGCQFYQKWDILYDLIISILFHYFNYSIILITFLIIFHQTLKLLRELYAPASLRTAPEVLAELEAELKLSKKRRKPTKSAADKTGSCLIGTQIDM